MTTTATTYAAHSLGGPHLSHGATPERSESMALGIITRQTLSQGTAQFVIYRKGIAYQVALIHPSQRLEPLPDATYGTYTAAHDRFEAEVRQRT